MPDALTTYIQFATVLVRRDRILQERIRMTTPSAIDRITAHAERVNDLMKKTDAAGEVADSVLNAYELSLGRFMAGVDQVNEKRKALDAVLPAMGNATTVLDKAFQDEKSPAAGTSVNDQQQEHAPHPMPPNTP